MAGGQRGIDKQHSKGKMTARERIESGCSTTVPSSRP